MVACLRRKAGGVQARTAIWRSGVLLSIRVVERHRGAGKGIAGDGRNSVESRTAMTGQLNLFKGKRQRGTQPPPPKEFALHCMVADTVRRWILPGWIWTHFPAGE